MPSLDFGNAVAIDGAEANMSNAIDGGETGFSLNIDGKEAGVFYDTGGGYDYNVLINKPKINGVELVDDKSFEDLGEETLTNLEILGIFNRVFGG